MSPLSPMSYAKITMFMTLLCLAASQSQTLPTCYYLLYDVV